MNRRISAFLPVAGDAADVRERFTHDPGDWLPGARPSGPGRWTVPLRYRGLTRTVEMHIGGVWQIGTTSWRSMIWSPVPGDGDLAAVDRWLPTLTGEIGLHVSGHTSSLVIAGTYDPPGAAIGGLADAVLLNRVAEGTATTFLRAVAPVLGRPAAVPA